MILGLRTISDSAANNAMTHRLGVGRVREGVVATTDGLPRFADYDLATRQVQQQRPWHKGLGKSQIPGVGRDVWAEALERWTRESSPSENHSSGRICADASPGGANPDHGDLVVPSGRSQI